MTTKNQVIQLLKKEFPTLRVGGDDVGYTELSVEEYEATIAQWADARLAKEAAATQAEAKAQAKVALLDRLGITADEAKLLLS
jgi:hypothetical protein